MANIEKYELSSKLVEKCFESALIELRKVLGDKVQIEISIDNVLAESLEQAFGLDASTGITELRNGNALMKIYSTDYLPFDTNKIVKDYTSNIKEKRVFYDEKKARDFFDSADIVRPEPRKLWKSQEGSDGREPIRK